MKNKFRLFSHVDFALIVCLFMGWASMTSPAAAAEEEERLSAYRAIWKTPFPRQGVDLSQGPRVLPPPIAVSAPRDPARADLPLRAEPRGI